MCLLSFCLTSAVFFVSHFSSRIFLLGPSHHFYTPKCALSTATVYKTPIGDLPVDVESKFGLSYQRKIFSLDEKLCSLFVFFRIYQ